MIKDFFKNYLIAILSFLFVLLITLLFFFQIRAWTDERKENTFLLRTAVIQALIERRMGFYLQLLRSGNSFFATSDTVTRTSWRKFVRGLQFQNDFPGIQGMGFAIRVPASLLEAHTEKIRNEGYPRYRIWPEGQREEYTSILFLEPFDWRNKRAFGFDMFTEAVRREAMIRARDYNVPSLSGKVLLVQETSQDRQPGFLIYTPVYEGGLDPGTVELRREKLYGYVYSPFRAKDFIEGIFKNQPSDIDFEIFDGAVLNEGDLLYNSDSDLDFKNPGNDLTRVIKLTLAGQTWTIFFSAKPSFGFVSDRSLSYTVLGGGTIIGLLLFSVMFFITKGRKAEKKSKEQLARQNEELKRINADLDNFIYTASHDLKAPISNLEGLFISLLSEIHMTEEILTLKGMIETSIERFKSTINDLTEISKVQKGLVEDFQLVSFKDILEEVKMGLKIQIENSQAMIYDEFKIAEVNFSRKNLRSILYNFISNAIKYASPDRKPVIKVSTEKEDHVIMLKVSDNGLGIPPDSLPKIFQMFKRVHDHVEGTGVGLYIVKRIIDNSGGKVEVESEQDKGTTFRVYFRTELQG